MERRSAYGGMVGCVAAVLLLLACSDGGEDAAPPPAPATPPAAPPPTAPPPASPPAPPATETAQSAAVLVDWEPSFAAPQTDPLGQRLTGTEIIDLAAFDGRLFAGNSYWNETTELRRGQVFRLDRSNGAWSLDLQMPARYSRVSALGGVTFTANSRGDAIMPQSFLIAGATYDYGNLPGPVGVFSRNAAGQWTLTDIGDTDNVIGYSEIRSIGFWRDSVTGADMVFLGASPEPHGVYSGVIDAASGALTWNATPEIPATSFQRFLAFAPCGGRLFAGAQRRIYRRIDGEPQSGGARWELFLDLQADAFQNAFGGVLTDADWISRDDLRGLTCLTDRANGAPYLIFGALNQMIRVDLDGNARLDLDIDAFLEEQLGRPVRYVQTAEHFADESALPAGASFIGFEVQYEPAFLLANPDTPHFPTSGFSTEGFYLERIDTGAGVRYALRTIERSPGEDLARVRAFEASPFSDEAGAVIYSGGYAPWFTPSTNTAWIKKGSLIDLSTRLAGASVERTADWRGSGVEALVVTPQGWTANAPTLIFSHGAGSSPESYLCWPEIFAERGARTVMPYLANDITAQTRAERYRSLARIHDAVAREQSVGDIVFGGHSFGAYASLLAAGADSRLPGVDAGNCAGSACAPLAAAAYVIISGQPAQTARNAQPFWFAPGAFASLAPGRIVVYGSQDFSSLDACMAPENGVPFCRGDSYSVDAVRAAEFGNREIIVEGFSHGQFACGLDWRSRADALTLQATISDIAGAALRRTR